MSSRSPSSRATEISRQSRYPGGSLPASIATAGSSAGREGGAAAITQTTAVTATSRKTIHLVKNFIRRLLLGMGHSNPCVAGRLQDEWAVVEELLAGDRVVLDRVEADFLVPLALAAGLGRELDGGVDAEPAGGRARVAQEERPAEVLALDGVVALEDLGLVDDRLLSNEFLAVGFDRDHLGRV